MAKLKIGFIGCGGIANGKHLPGMAQQKEFRSTAAARMRYKMMHKFHDYKARFEDSHMCVGCGRCTHRCPEFISISATLNKMNQAVLEIKESLNQGGDK